MHIISLSKWKNVLQLHRSLKELRWLAVDERKSQNDAVIIPGDWGKVVSGWLARPLSERVARFASGGRIHQFLRWVSQPTVLRMRNLAARSD